MFPWLKKRISSWCRMCMAGVLYFSQSHHQGVRQGCMAKQYSWKSSVCGSTCSLLQAVVATESTRRMRLFCRHLYDDYSSPASCALHFKISCGKLLFRTLGQMVPATSIAGWEARLAGWVTSLQLFWPCAVKEGVMAMQAPMQLHQGCADGSRSTK